MDTETTQLQTPPPTRRAWLPALGVAAIAIAVVAAGALLLSDRGTDVATDRESAAIARAESYFAAINGGDVEAAATALDPSALSQADGRMLDFNVFSTAAYPWQLQSCEVVGSDGEVVLVDCAFTITDPVFIAEGVSELIAPFTVHNDGLMESRLWQGANFSLANRAYAEYLRTRHEADYNEVCHVSAYPTGSVNHDGGLVFTRECAELAIPLAPTIAEWVEAGKPAS